MKLFKKISGKNAIDFERIDRCLQSDSTRKVAPQHSEDLDTINLCLEYFLKFKILYLFSATPQATNPNRATILRDLLRFFSSYLILRENTRNEEFLAETIESLIDLPIDVITSQASIAPTYALADVFKLNESCKELFRSSNAIKKHILKAHNGGGFRCPFHACSSKATFEHRSNLLVHLTSKKYHGYPKSAVTTQMADDFFNERFRKSSENM